jgi:molecular chaperone DnaK (HSP70)
MLFNSRSQKLFRFFLIYIFLKAKFNIIEKEKLNYEKGKKLNFIEENFFQKEKLYISIDFGNYKSKYAYNFGGAKNVIYEGKMQSIPSVIILNKSNFTVRNYGWKSIHSIANYNENEKNEIIFLNNLKLTLYNKKIGQKFDDKEILSIEYYKRKGIIGFLRSFSDDALAEINSFIRNECEKYNKSEVNWIISVPKIWDDYSKLNLLQFGKEAGMNNIDLVLEPEAATLSFFDDKFIDFKYKQEGHYFMMIDLGEYICDITINEIIDNFGNIKQLSLPLGDNFVSMNINNDIIDIKILFRNFLI